MYGKHIDTLDKISETLNKKGIPDLQKASEAAAATAREYETKIASLSDVTPDQVPGKYIDMLDDLRKSNRINPTQYAEGRALAAQSKDAFKDVATREKWKKAALYSLGASGSALVGAHTAGIPLLLGLTGVGVGAAGYVGRKALQKGIGKAFKGH
jgi:hypothetical protein